MAPPRPLATCAEAVLAARKPGIRWQELTEEKIAAIPLLAIKRDRGSG